MQNTNIITMQDTEPDTEIIYNAEEVEREQPEPEESEHEEPEQEEPENEESQNDESQNDESQTDESQNESGSQSPSMSHTTESLTTTESCNNMDASISQTSDSNNMDSSVSQTSDSHSSVTQESLQSRKDKGLEWECYHCGLVNFQDSLCCGACFQECIYNEYDGDNDSNTSSKKETSTLDIIKFIANNSLKFMNAKQIQLHNVSEDMANENLGSVHLFGMFGDVRKIEIIRKKKSKKIKAVVTYYSPESVSALMKLSSSYHNFKIFGLFWNVRRLL